MSKRFRRRRSFLWMRREKSSNKARSFTLSLTFEKCVGRKFGLVLAVFHQSQAWGKWDHAGYQPIYDTASCPYIDRVRNFRVRCTQEVKGLWGHIRLGSSSSVECRCVRQSLAQSKICELHPPLWRTMDDQNILQRSISIELPAAHSRVRYLGLEITMRKGLCMHNC